ncbi:ras and Rab interactor 3-like isoform X1 [Arapaima gigas]
METKVFAPSAGPSSGVALSTQSPATPKTMPTTPESCSPCIPSSSSRPLWGSPSSSNVVSAPDINILEKLIKTCPVWLQLGITESRASLILQREPPGIFLVRKNADLKKMVLSVRLSDQESSSQILDLLIKEEKSLIYLEGSLLVFDNIFKLIAFYCVSRDILPFTLKLPQVIVQATKYDDMDIISSLGSDFWGSSLNRPLEVGGAGVSGGNQNISDPSHSRESRTSCEIELSTGGNRLWYVNPVFIEESRDDLRAAASVTQSQTMTSQPGPEQPRYKRPAPQPPRPHRPLLQLTGLKKEGSSSTPRETALSAESDAADKRGGPHLVAPHHRLTEQQPLEEPTAQSKESARQEENQQSDPVTTQLRVDRTAAAERSPTGETGALQKAEMTDCASGTAVPQDEARKLAPVPPPRRKRFSHIGTQLRCPKVEEEPQRFPRSPTTKQTHKHMPSSSRYSRASMCTAPPRGPDVSLFSPEGGAPRLDHDSHSTSSTEEEADLVSATSITQPFKRSPTFMLDKAKKRLSRVSLSQMFTGLMSNEHKLRNRIVQLARDKDSYFGNLVLDHRTFTLETMRKHATSTEMLQEIRQMMTQLKSYLIQSAELRAQPESSIYPEEKLEVIIEAALAKSVLKPLCEPIYTCLREIHKQDTSLARLHENQQVVLNTTTTDLGVTTSVPEMAELEKIQFRLDLMHEEYSPEKKISILLKTCKIIYDSMSVGCPAGRTLGADDFLPVLMYVVAHCNIEALMLDVEYMMELMDPALQLGEGKAPFCVLTSIRYFHACILIGSYYLTTTYGALEQIKNYDILPMTRQLSLEVQDSIHRWEKRRTLNKARMSCSSVQDFIKVSFLEPGSNTKTLGVQASTTTQELCSQCAEKFEITEPEAYRLYIVVDGVHQSLAAEELPLSVKSSLHHSEHRSQYHFVYRQAICEQETDPATSLMSQSATTATVPCSS